jgi:hypothetical protein
MTEDSLLHDVWEMMSTFGLTAFLNPGPLIKDMFSNYFFPPSWRTRVTDAHLLLGNRDIWSRKHVQQKNGQCA